MGGGGGRIGRRKRELEEGKKWGKTLEKVRGLEDFVLKAVSTYLPFFHGQICGEQS